MANLRTFYACQAVAIQRLQYVDEDTWTPVGSYEFVHGVQSVGINTNFEVENIFELGQIEIYDSVLQIPTVEITLEKVLDDHPSIYGTLSNGQDLLAAGKDRANVIFNIFKDTENAGETSPVYQVECTGMYVNNVSYTFPVDGNCTESVTLSGNSKQTGGTVSVPAAVSNGTDEPASPHVLRRQDVVYTGPHSNKIQSITLSVDLGREDIFELGTLPPKFKVPTYPVEVTAEIEVLANEDTADDNVFTQDTTDIPETDQSISVTAGNLTVNLGGKCFLKSTQYGGGDASGGNATQQYSYSTYNEFTVTG